jgi:hypothetical protein
VSISLARNMSASESASPAVVSFGTAAPTVSSRLFVRVSVDAADDGFDDARDDGREELAFRFLLSSSSSSEPSVVAWGDLDEDFFFRCRDEDDDDEVELVFALSSLSGDAGESTTTISGDARISAASVASNSPFLSDCFFECLLRDVFKLSLMEL